MADEGDLLRPYPRPFALCVDQFGAPPDECPVQTVMQHCHLDRRAIGAVEMHRNARTIVGKIGQHDPRAVGHKHTSCAALALACQGIKQHAIARGVVKLLGRFASEGHQLFPWARLQERAVPHPTSRDKLQDACIIRAYEAGDTGAADAIGANRLRSSSQLTTGSPCASTVSVSSLIPNANLALLSQFFIVHAVEHRLTQIIETLDDRRRQSRRQDEQPLLVAVE